jgi:membrane fusion protein, multidrug efflux system
MAILQQVCNSVAQFCNVVLATSQTTGKVIAIEADNTDIVSAGLVMIKLNPVDAKISLKRAEEQLAKTVCQVH